MHHSSLAQPLSETGNTLQAGCVVGDPAFWTPGDLFALSFDEPQRVPEGPVIPGRVTPDSSTFMAMENSENMAISLTN